MNTNSHGTVYFLKSGDRKMAKPKGITTIILDVDETLTYVNVWQYLTKALGEDPAENKKIYGKYNQGEYGPDEGIKAVVDLWNRKKIRTKDEITGLLDKVKIKPDALEAVKYLQTKYNVIIISGSIEILVERVAKLLNIKEFYALTELEFDENQNLTWFQYPKNEAIEKVNLFKKYAELNAIEAREVAIIGDGYSDSELFKVLGFKVLITSDDNRKDMKENADVIIDELIELTEIF